jgi:hypothetical protein
VLVRSFVRSHAIILVVTSNPSSKTREKMTADLFLHFLLQKELSVTQKRSCGESTMQEAITAMCNNKISLNNDVKLQVRFKSWQKLFDIFFCTQSKSFFVLRIFAQVKFKFWQARLFYANTSLWTPKRFLEIPLVICLRSYFQNVN